jgi:hypothetical protein
MPHEIVRIEAEGYVFFGHEPVVTTSHQDIKGHSVTNPKTTEIINNKNQHHLLVLQTDR